MQSNNPRVRKPARCGCLSNWAGCTKRTKSCSALKTRRYPSRDGVSQNVIGVLNAPYEGMKMNKIKTLLCLSCTIPLFYAPIYAQETKSENNSQDNDAELDAVYTASNLRETAIVVSASGSKNRLSDNGLAISVIGQAEIDRLQTQDITTVLERVPGVTTTRNGPLGGFTGVRIRGSEAEQVLVLVDGVRVNDPSSPGGGFDFGNLLTGGLSKIEILRGSNSIIWGSQAIGGVVNVTTSSRDDRLRANAEYGRDDTRSFSASLNQNIGGSNIGLSAGYFNNDGFSSFDGGIENDGFEQFYINGRADIAITDTITAKIRGRFADGLLEIDGFPAPAFAFADTNELQDTQEISAYGGLEYAADNFTVSAAYSILDNNRDNFDPTNEFSFDFFSRGRTERIELRANIAIANRFTLDIGAENEESAFTTGPFGASAGSGIDSIYGYVSGEFGDLNIAGGVRLDDHEQFGTEIVFGSNIIYAITDNIGIKAAYNEGFKAPTLFQLLSDFGNETLNPEESKSYEIGISSSDRNGNGLFWELTAFQRDTDNQIDFISCFGVTDSICDNRPFGTFDNIVRTRARGIEAQLGAAITDNFTASAAYSYVDTENRSAGSANEGNALARRPDHALTVSADWSGEIRNRAIGFGADMRIVGDSFDDAGNNTALDGYALFTLRASADISNNFQLYGRLENLFDEQYQTAAGFATPGFGGFVGIRAKF